MEISALAGKPAPRNLLVDLALLEREYYERRPDVGDPNQLVSFGTSGHRGSSLRGMFTEAHILAITQAICDYRRSRWIDGPLYLGKDTHGLSGPAQRTALEVLTADQVETFIQRDDGVTPTPVISHAILVYNRGRKQHFADSSGTENIYKIYAESFKDQTHLDAILSEAREMVKNALNSTAPRGGQAEGQP
jgi:phosphoglucomutase